MSDIPQAVASLTAEASEPANSSDAAYVEVVAAVAELLKAIAATRSVCPTGVVAEAERLATASVVAEAAPPNLPPGFPTQGLQLYDAAEEDYLFTFGHVSPERMTAAVSDWIRHIHYAEEAVVEDPLAILAGGGERVRATIQHTYATYDPRPSGVCAFSARKFVDPDTEGAVPITYWPGEDG
ncbi:hypothetical protein AB0392_32330 [Nonomuraea angiospora]|uniref:hypothetical protein n=1 Tax=Nonomuraea angiospora TaxID=46172 RepID=UPI00344F4873